MTSSSSKTITTTATTTTGTPLYTPYTINTNSLYYYQNPAPTTTSIINDYLNQNFVILKNNSKKEEKEKLLYFKEIKEYVPNRVYQFTFNDDVKIKTTLHQSDVFSLSYAFYLAIAKKLYSKEYTLQGVMKKAEELSYQKEYVKIVNKGIKLFNKQKEEKELEVQKQKEEKLRHQKNYQKKLEKEKRKKEQKQTELQETILQAILESKKMTNFISLT